MNAHRKGSDTFAYSISSEVLVQVAAAAGIVESDVRRALVELFSDRTFEPDTLAWKLYGKSRLKAVREVERPAEATRTRLEDFLRHKQGLKLRRKTEANSLWDAGDLLGTVRRALDFSAITPCSRCDLWSSGSRTWATGEVVSASSPTSRTSAEQPRWAASSAPRLPFLWR